VKSGVDVRNQGKGVVVLASGSSFGMAATGDDSDDADDDEDGKRIRKAFHNASAGAFPFGSGGRAASCMMTRARATYIQDHVSRHVKRDPEHK